MLEQFEVLIVDGVVGQQEATGEAATEQPEPEPPLAEAPPWVDYAVYSGIGAIILFLFLRGMKGGRRAPAEPEAPPAPPVEKPPTPTQAEVEAEARKTFRIPQVLVPGAEREPRPAPPTPERAEAAPPAAAPEIPPPVRAPERAPEKAPPAKAPPKKAPPVEAPTPEEAPPAVEVREKAPPPAKMPEKAPPPAKAPPEERYEEAGRTLREGLARTHDGFVKRLGKLFGGAKTIDDDLLAELEETLFTADIGVRTSQKLVELVHDSLSRKELQDPEKVWARLQAEIGRTLAVEAPPVDFDRAKPFVIMIVGVNGAGKTTTIGKLARQLSSQGRRVLLAAGDTFRAAAVEQLEVWGERAGVPVVKGREKQDPGSVVFDACKRAVDEDHDVVIVDTAGRLQARKELMDELAKVHRVIGKAVPGAPHETWLVLDATNGQNAISQAKEFTQAVAVTGIIMTKLDGTAKGGVVIGICDEMRLPVRYIGIGEKVEDLRLFDPEAFARALFAEE